jgi:putative ATPase
MRLSSPKLGPTGAIHRASRQGDASRRICYHRDMAKPRSTPPSAPLFESAQLTTDDASRPLADRARPKSLAEVIGQDHLLGDNGPLRRIAEGEPPRSMIFWGPPGTGKTTVARLMARGAGLHFEQLSAIFSGVQDLRKVFEEARDRRRFGQGTILFVDEIHRFNRSQQDSFLPYVEDGTIILIGATTENPSFELNGALLSRTKVLVFQRLGEDGLEQLLSRAENITGRKLPLTAEARAALLGMADGDGRSVLNLTQDVYDATREGEPPVDAAKLVTLVQRRAPLYDKNRDGHYDLISALHKAVRGSDPDAALYWFCRMIDGGEAPLFLARRLVRMAVEDIGLADPQALVQANAAKDAYDFLGSPEGELALAQCVIYLAAAPKSNAAYKAYGAALRLAKEGGSLSPPKHILNAPTKLMRNEGYGAGYVYDHATEEGVSGQNYFPDGMERQQFYQPRGRGYEEEIKGRLEAWTEIRRNAAKRQPLPSE